VVGATLGGADGPVPRVPQPARATLAIKRLVASALMRRIVLIPLLDSLSSGIHISIVTEKDHKGCIDNISLSYRVGLSGDEGRTAEGVADFRDIREDH
jgi:hypothetical protein